MSMLAVATASCRAMLMPMPPTGDMAWAASPMQSRPGEDHCWRRLTSTVRSLILSQESRTVVRPGEEGDDAFDALLEGGEAGGLELGEGAFGDGVADLVVVVAIDEDDEAAVVDVAEAVLGVGGPAGDAEPEDVDGDAVVDEREDGRRRGRWRGGRRSLR